MEQRLYAREPLALTVRLVQRGRAFAIVRTIDMSRDGLAVMAPEVELQNGQPLVVDFVKPGHPRDISCCVPFTVVRSGPKSVGLMFSREAALQTLSLEHCIDSSSHRAQGVGHAKSTST